MRYKKIVKIRAFAIVELLVIISILVFLFFIVVPILMNSPSRREKREAISYEKINEASVELLKRNTKQLESAGAATVTEFLK